MRVFAHRTHVYMDRARHSILQIPAGGWKEVSDALGALLLADHPTKLCDVTNEADPDRHVCPITAVVEAEREAYKERMMHAPPIDTMPKPRLSGQKRQLLKKAKARSRTARMKT